MAERGVYEWMLGINPRLHGLVIDPCIPSKLPHVSASFYYRNKRVSLTIENGNGKCSGVTRVKVNGKEIHTQTKKLFHDSKVFLITPDNLCLSDNKILVVL